MVQCSSPDQPTMKGGAAELSLVQARGFQRHAVNLAAALSFALAWLAGTIASSAAVEINRLANHLYLSGFIAEDSPGRVGRAINSAILELAADGDQGSPIHLHLNLPKGGFAAQSFELVKLVRSAQAHGTKIVAHVEAGQTCMSGCTFLFLAADERWIAKEGRLIFHGFSQRDPDNPVSVPEAYKDQYYALLNGANERFYHFFVHARIVEDDIKVGFTGKALHDGTLFTGLITGLLN